MKSSQEIQEVGRRMRTSSLGTTENIFSGSPPPPPQPANGFYVSKKTHIHTPGKEEMQPAHRAGISEINLSIGAGLNLQYEEIIFEFYSNICMILPPPPQNSQHEQPHQIIASQRPIQKHPTLSQKKIFLVYVSASIMSYLKGGNEIKILSEIFIDLIKPHSLS